MSYLQPSEFVTKLVDQGEAKVYMSERDTILRGAMAGATLALAVLFAVSAAVNTGTFLIGALIFPVGFSMLYLMGYDLLTGVFMLIPIAWLDGRPGVTLPRMLKCWALVGIGNLVGSLFIAFFSYLYFTNGFNAEVNAIGEQVMAVGEKRTGAGSICSCAACSVTGWFPWALSVRLSPRVCRVRSSACGCPSSCSSTSASSTPW